MIEGYLTPTQLAKEWGRSRSFINTKIRQGVIPALKIELEKSVRYLIPRTVLIHPDEVG